LVRYFNTPRLRDCLRITVGTPEQNRRLCDQLAHLLGH
jgi:histidinol-phosphate/aromatic aminotransferase/cobyric acid decarboxylase-like protein